MSDQALIHKSRWKSLNGLNGIYATLIILKTSIGEMYNFYRVKPLTHLTQTDLSI